MGFAVVSRDDSILSDDKPDKSDLRLATHHNALEKVIAVGRS